MSDKPQMPHEGGSYIRKPDGSLDRTEFTRQPGDPGFVRGGHRAPPGPKPAPPKSDSGVRPAKTGER